MDMDCDKSVILLKALGHPVRLQIVDILRRGEICVCHIEAVLGRRQAYISQQLMVLREAGLVEYRKDGLQVFYRLANPVADELLDILCGVGGDGGHDMIADCERPSCQELLEIEREKSC